MIYSENMLNVRLNSKYHDYGNHKAKIVVSVNIGQR